VDDLLEGMVRMMETGDEVTGPVNLGNPVEFTILELAEKIISMTASSSKITFLPLPQDDPIQRKPDISLAGKILGGWEPAVDLEAGLERTIAYFDQLLKEA
jgi:UDP-glucuronate decarboxylase